MKNHASYTYTHFIAVFILFVASAIVRAQAPDWFWTGSFSHNWADSANWTNSVGDNPEIPADFNDKRLCVTSDGIFNPTNQNINNLTVFEVGFLVTNSYSIGGEPITLRNFLVNNKCERNQTISLHNDLTLIENRTWDMGGVDFSLKLYGAIYESAPGCKIRSDGHGRVHFYGPAFISGGFNPHTGVQYFYGLETLGAPSEPVLKFLESDWGGFTFCAPPDHTGAFYDYDLPDTIGVRGKAQFTANPRTEVTIFINGPVTGTGELGENAAVVMNSANASWTGRLNLGNSTFFFNTPIPATPWGSIVDGNAFNIELNGFDFLNRNMAFANNSGEENCGQIRNQNREKASTINGDITQPVTNSGERQFGGAGDIIYTGTISNRLSTAHSFVKVGSGTFTFKGASHFEGDANTFANVDILGGKLVLDYADNNTSKIGDKATLSLAGALDVIGNETADTTEVFGALSAGSGGDFNTARVNISGRAGRAATLKFGSLTVNSNSDIDFNPYDGGAILASNVANNANTGIILARATFQNRTFARVSSEPADTQGYKIIEGLPNEDYADSFDLGNDYEIVDIVGDMTVTDAENVAALRFNSPAPSSLTLASGKLNVNGEDDDGNGYQGSVLVTENVGTNEVVISGGYHLCHNGANGALHLIQNNTAAPLRIDARMNEFSSGACLAKSGAGEVILGNRYNNFSTLLIYEGTIAFTNITCLGSGNDAILLGGATLKYTGAGETHNRSLKLRGHGFIEAAGSGPIAFTNALSINPADNGRDNWLTLTGAGSGEIRGKIDLRLGKLVKQGSGEWIISPTDIINDFRGGARVDAGTLTMAGGVLGYDVEIRAGGTLIGLGEIRHDLFVRNGGTLALDPESGALLVGKNLILDAGSILSIPRASLTDEWQPVLRAANKITGEFSEKPEYAFVRIAGNEVSVKFRAIGSTIIIR